MESNAKPIEVSPVKSGKFRTVVFQAVLLGDLRDDYANQSYFSAIMENGMGFKQWLYANGLEENKAFQEFLECDKVEVKTRFFTYSDFTDQCEAMLSAFYQNVSSQVPGIHMMLTGKNGKIYKCTVKQTVLIPNYKLDFLLTQIYIDAKLDPLGKPNQ